MSVYRVTEFVSSDMEKAIGRLESFREEVAGANAESIDIVSVGDGKGLVVAKYATEAAMVAATEINKQVFGQMIAAELIDGSSVNGQSGEVVFSF